VVRQETDVTGTYLSPIEQLQGLMMKLAYYFTRRQFGKVLTPLKVHSARLPAAFGLFYAKVEPCQQDGNPIQGHVRVPPKKGTRHGTVQGQCTAYPARGMGKMTEYSDTSE
jgi:hypothetical protein